MTGFILFLANFPRGTIFLFAVAFFYYIETRSLKFNKRRDRVANVFGQGHSRGLSCLLATTINEACQVKTEEEVASVGRVKSRLLQQQKITSE